MEQGYGFIKDKIDLRDFKFEDKIYGVSALPPVVFKEIDLRKDECMPNTYESQGIINSCVIYSWMKTLELNINRARKKKYNTNGFKFNNVLSKKFLYYTTKFLTDEDTVCQNNGVSFRFIAKTLMQVGVCTKEFCGDSTDISTQPTYNASIKASLYKINAYYTIDTLQGILASLDMGLPVQIGTDINGFDDARTTGYSAKSELWDSSTPLNANHAMVIVGTTFLKGKWMFIIGNSYGETWGDRTGYCYIDAQKMWDFNIYQAMVMVMDTFVEDLDKENKDYLTAQKLPNNSIILGNYAFDLDYSNTYANEEEITNAVVAGKGNSFIVDINGDIYDSVTCEEITINELTSRIGHTIIYKNRDGLIKTIHI
jgi:hypothetical protein